MYLVIATSEYFCFARLVPLIDMQSSFRVGGGEGIWCSRLLFTLRASPSGSPAVDPSARS